MGEPKNTSAALPDESEATRWVAEFDPSPLTTALLNRSGGADPEYCRRMVVTEWLADRKPSETKKRLEYLAAIAAGQVPTEEDYL